MSVAMRKSERIVLGAGLGHDGTPSASVSSAVGLSRCKVDKRIGCNQPTSRSAGVRAIYFCEFVSGVTLARQLREWDRMLSRGRTTGMLPRARTFLRVRMVQCSGFQETHDRSLRHARGMPFVSLVAIVLRMCP